MTGKMINYLQALGNFDRARILAHLAEHDGETAELISGHLNYPRASVYKYLRELEDAGLIKSERKNRVRQYYIIPFDIRINQETLREVFHETEPSYLQVIRERYGREKLSEIRQLAEGLKMGTTTLTLRQLASDLGMEYYELMIALDELRVL
jgi:predicted transcriptional regulator